MKKLFFLFFISWFSNSGLAQEENNPYGTTLKEYNYVTKGYATQVDLGLDILSGYELLDLGSSSIITGDEGEINVELKKFRNSSIMDSSNYPGPWSETNRATMVIIRSSTYDFKLYLCIPNYYSSQDLWDKYLDEISGLNKNYLLAISWALSNCNRLDSNSYIKENGTTLKEYNYVTKGYATQIEQGLDILKGYYFWDWGTYGINTIEEEINIETKDLSKEISNDTNGIQVIEVATMIIINNIQNDYKKYLCIPNSRIYASSDLWTKYFDELKYLNQNYILALTWSLSHFYNKL